MPPSAPPERSEVTHLDEAGLGVAAGCPPIALAAPGDVVWRSCAGIEIEPLSPHRAAPPCSHFGTCGGCSLQHLNDTTYAAWKTGKVRRAFTAVGLDAPMDPLVRSTLASRRRATFSAVRNGSSIAFGFRTRRSHAVVDLAACPALAPAFAAALPAIRALSERAARTVGDVRVVVNGCANGFDVGLATEKSRPQRAGPRKRKAKPPTLPPDLVGNDPALARVSVNGETILQRESPVVILPGGQVVPPPGAFLQATREGERALIAAVSEAAAGAARIADLFCGIGTFAVPLARHASVLAVEGDAPALRALDAAVRPPGTRPISTQRRNLMAHPLAPGELDGFDAVLFDPPRAGAQAQADALARSQVPTVIAVSCEPATLARDCARLVEGGYTITKVTPIDQFVATAHVEAVAVLRRKP